MKQCDHLATIASSSPSFPPSESDPDDSFWRDFTFDFSFLTSDDHKTVPKELELTGADSNVTIVEERSPPPPPPPSSSVLGVTGEACSRNESAFSPLFAKMSALGVKECSNECDEDESEVDSPCWKGTWPKSLRSRDDLSVLYGLNPMAPQFIPSNAMMKNGKDEFGENGSPSLKRSLSSTFPPSSSSGAFSISNLYEAGIEQTNSILHDAEDESLGLVCQEDSVSDISNQFQRRVKLDPLAPVFVPAYAVDKSGLADHMIAAERNASSEVGHIGSNPYSSNPQLGSQVRISENTKLDSSSSKTHGSKKKLNPLAPQFSLADTKPKVYGSMENNVNTSVLFSPASYRNNQELLHGGLTQPSVHVGPSYKEVDTNQMGRYRSMDVKKLLTTIHGLSELLTHVHGSDTSGSPNEQDLDLINSTVQNLNSYIKNNGVTGQYDGVTSLPNMCKQSISEHTIPKARSLSPSVDFKRKEKYPMVLGAEPQVEYGVTKESGFGQGLRNHQTGEQINPHVLFYKSLWLKARADKSLMEYETFLSNSRT